MGDASWLIRVLKVCQRMFTRVLNGTMRVSIEGAAETLHVVDFRSRQTGCFVVELHIAVVARGVFHVCEMGARRSKLENEQKSCPYVFMVCPNRLAASYVGNDVIGCYL